jgi:methylmalonyl-CoA/ethylmalonyl-CoA epimerase
MIDLPGDPPLRFHHIGMACTDLDAETRRLAILGYRPEGEDFTDLNQGVHGRFLGGQAPRLELLIQLAGNSVLAPWLINNIKMYHLAYETDDLEDAITKLCSQKSKLVVPPVPAIAFDNRQIAFVMLPNMLLVELISNM